jgi:pyruvate/2-oxoglutarate dehydrogenase complex dihydrolipoamide acyltransferase (E2) component
MDWGDAPAWAAIVVSVGAVIVSLKARGDGNRAATAAENSVTESKRSADAAEVSARVAEETLADQRREAAERRAAEAAAAVPRAHLKVRHVSKDLYRLENDGTGPALDITFEQDDLPPVFRLRNTGEVSLQADEAIDFLMAGTWGAPVPPQLFARWQGQDELVPLRVPPKR